MDIKKEMKKANDKWCEYLKDFWKETLYNENFKLRLIAEKLSLAVTPIAILPFERHLYAKYVDPDANQLGRREYKLLVNSKRPRSSEWRKIPLAKGLHDSIVINNPYIWHKLLPYQEGVKVEGIDEKVRVFEDKLFQSKLKELSYRKSEQVKTKGHFAIPLFHGTIPIYCLVIISNTISPEIFNARYLRETFDMIGRIGESILNDKFVSLWEKFCENYREVGEPRSRERKNVFKILERRLLGKVPKRDYSSWIHSLPGHRIYENEGQKRIKDNFVNKWELIKDRLIEGEEWYERHIKKLMDIAKKIKLFAKVHEMKKTKHLNTIKNIINKENDFIMELNECEWFRDIINILAKSKLKEAQMEFYKLKSILNLTDYKNKTISAGFIYEWSNICKQDSVHELYEKKSIDIDFYEAEVCISNPFCFVIFFHSFISSFNNRKKLQTCKIKQIQIVNRCINESTVIKIICKLSRKFPSDLETLLSDRNKHTMILKNKGGKRNTSFFLCNLIRICKCEIISSGKTIKFTLVS